MIGGYRDIALARGLTDETGARHRRARLSPIDGYAEAAIGVVAGDAQAEHEFLAQRIERLGGYSPATPELVSMLSLADQDHLAMEIRADLFGDRLFLSAECCNPSCGEWADVSISLSELIGDTKDVPERIHSDNYKQLSAHPPLGNNGRQSTNIWPELIDEHINWSEISEQHQQTLALSMARHDAQPDLGIAAPCPACGLLIEFEIDPFALLERELKQGTSRLTAEIHCLAFHYGWTEAEILSLPRERRWRYLQLLGEQLSGQSLSTGGN